MPFSPFSHLLSVDRTRLRLNRSATAAGFAMPALGEVQLTNVPEPALLATNMRGTFLLTRKSSEGIARYGFSPCEPANEPVLLTELARVLWELSPQHEWDIRCSGVPEAVESFRTHGLEARTVVVSSQLARSVLGQDALPPEGLAGTVGKMQVLVTGLPENVALVALAPENAGVCVRTGDNMGMLVRPQAFRVVQT